MNILGNVDVFYTDGDSQPKNTQKVKQVMQESNLLEDDIPF